tara:strand:- start:787 stop:1095 length:309 start_codon:yes stop_codon:yes gene_type:complete
MDLDQLSWRKKILSEENVFILDVRTSEEFEDSRIPNSINIDFYNPQNFMSELRKLDKNSKYFVYCRSGVRSANSCTLMVELGFKEVYNLLGGIVEWSGKLVN